jgi:hypothetical protein
MWNHGLLHLLELGEPRPPGIALGEHASISSGERPSTNAPSTPVSIARRASRRQLLVRPEQENVEARDHLRDVLVRDVRQFALHSSANVMYAP